MLDCLSTGARTRPAPDNTQEVRRSAMSAPQPPRSAGPQAASPQSDAEAALAGAPMAEIPLDVPSALSAGIHTPDQRIRIFVSSTLDELAPERAAVRQAIEQLRLT